MIRLTSQQYLLGLTVALLAAHSAAVEITTLTNGEPLSALSGASASSQYFMLDVPDGATNLVIKISGGTGDADLYVKSGELPDLYSFDCRPYLYGNNESCSTLTETNIPYYIMLQGYSAYSGVTLSASYSESDSSGGDSGQSSECTMTDIQVELLATHNAARGEGRYCGSTYYPAAPELSWNCNLATAAANHNQDMVDNNFFSHTGSDGSLPWDRAQAAGYNYSYVGENIAAGYTTVDDAMSGWLASSGHCSNIMSQDYTEMGADMLYSDSADYGYYWTSVFGSPQ